MGPTKLTEGFRGRATRMLHTPNLVPDPLRSGEQAQRRSERAAVYSAPNTSFNEFTAESAQPVQFSRASALLLTVLEQGVASFVL